MIPSYGLVVSLLTMGLAAYLLAEKPLISLLAGLVVLVVFGENGRIAAVQVTWLLAFITGLLDTIGVWDNDTD